MGDGKVHNSAQAAAYSHLSNLMSLGIRGITRRMALLLPEQGKELPGDKLDKISSPRRPTCRGKIVGVIIRGTYAYSDCAVWISSVLSQKLIYQLAQRMDEI